jgi:hypothetical protein
MFNYLANNISRLYEKKINSLAICDNLETVNRLINAQSAPPPVFLISPSRLRMHGGLCFDKKKHPFIKALKNGKISLQEYYNNFQPRNLEEMYYLPKTCARGYDLPPWVLPWMPQNVTYAPTGENGLSLVHGVSYYGPASEEKIDLEYSRLKSIEESILKNGYNPQIGGHISGWFMLNQDDFVFFVRGGKHRTAVLTHLFPDKPVAVSLRLDFPKVFRDAESALWDQVKIDLIEEKIAKMIFSKYFNSSIE